MLKPAMTYHLSCEIFFLLKLDIGRLGQFFPGLNDLLLQGLDTLYPFLFCLLEAIQFESQLLSFTFLYSIRKKSTLKIRVTGQTHELLNGVILACHLLELCLGGLLYRVTRFVKLLVFGIQFSKYAGISIHGHPINKRRVADLRRAWAGSFLALSFMTFS